MQANAFVPLREAPRNKIVRAERTCSYASKLATIKTSAQLAIIKNKIKYLRTRLATDWKVRESLLEKSLKKVLFCVAEVNPDYENKMHLVKEWYVEFDENDNPWREIGIDGNGIPIVAGPDKRNYGFWLAWIIHEMS